MISWQSREMLCIPKNEAGDEAIEKQLILRALNVDSLRRPEVKHRLAFWRRPEETLMNDRRLDGF